ncbi:hypothetical protein B5X24_HaOG214440, partial [Helicoverpa armigera]
MQCPYADKCFRLNPIHFKEYSHEHLESILDSYTGSGDFPIPSKLQSQKQMYVDQLKMLLQQQLYTPGKNFGTEPSAGASTSTTSEDVKPQKRPEERSVTLKPVSDQKQRESSKSPHDRGGSSSSRSRSGESKESSSGRSQK